MTFNARDIFLTPVGWQRFAAPEGGYGKALPEWHFSPVFAPTYPRLCNWHTLCFQHKSHVDHKPQKRTPYTKRKQPQT